MRIRKPVISFDADHPMSHLHVVADLATADVASEIRLEGCWRVWRQEMSAHVSPRRADESARVQARPVIARDWRTSVLEAAARLRAELVAKPRIDAHALDDIADAIIDASIAEPSAVSQHRSRSQRELTVGAHTAVRVRREQYAVDRRVSTGFQRPGGHVTRKFVEDAGREVGLPSDLAGGNGSPDPDCGAAEHALDVIDRHCAARESKPTSGYQSGHTERVDLHTRPDDTARWLDKPVIVQRDIIPHVAGHRDAARIEALIEQAVVPVGQVVLIKIPADLSVGEEVLSRKGGIDARKWNLRRSGEATLRCRKGESAVDERTRRRDVIGPGIDVSGSHAPMPVGSGAAAVEYRKIVADLKSRIVLADGGLAMLRARSDQPYRSEVEGRGARIVCVDRSSDHAAPCTTALLIGLWVAWGADESARARQERRVDRIDGRRQCAQ